MFLCIEEMVYNCIFPKSEISEWRNVTYDSYLFGELFQSFELRMFLCK